jgi:hypothetical protein
MVFLVNDNSSCGYIYACSALNFSLYGTRKVGETEIICRMIDNARCHKKILSLRVDCVLLPRV